MVRVKRVANRDGSFQFGGSGSGRRINGNRGRQVGYVRADKGPRLAVGRDRKDHWRAVGRPGVESDIACRKGRHRNDGRVQIGRGSRHVIKRPGSNRVIRIVERVPGHAVRKEGVVQDQGNHVRGDPSWRRNVDRIGRRKQGIIAAELVGVHPYQLVSRPIPEGHGNPGRCQFFAVNRAGLIELGSQVIVYKPHRPGRLGNLCEEEEINRSILRHVEADLLPVAQGTCYRRIFVIRRLDQVRDTRQGIPISIRLETQPLGNLVLFPHADRGKKKGTGLEGLAKIHVLVFLLKQFIARRGYGFNNV